MFENSDASPTPDVLMAQLPFITLPDEDFVSTKPGGDSRMIYISHKLDTPGRYCLLPYILPGDNESNGLPFYTCVFQKSQTLLTTSNLATFTITRGVEAICGTIDGGLKLDGMVNPEGSTSVQAAGSSLNGSRLGLVVPTDPSFAPYFDSATTKASALTVDSWQIQAPIIFKVGPNIGMLRHFPNILIAYLHKYANFYAHSIMTNYLPVPVFVGYAMQTPGDDLSRAPLVVCQAAPGNVYTFTPPLSWLVAFWGLIVESTRVKS